MRNLLLLQALFLLFLASALPAGAAVKIHYVINDHLGTPQMLVDENQNVVWKAEYDEFGHAHILIEEIEFNPRFPGQYYDKETGLNYNYYRDYDPALGRYIQADPIGILKRFDDPAMNVAMELGVPLNVGGSVFSGLNHLYGYGYGGGNPVSYIDPLGLFMCPPGQRGYYIDSSETAYICRDGGSSSGFGTGDASAFPASTNDACVQECIKKESLDCVTPTSSKFTSSDALQTAACASAVVMSCSAQTCDKCDAEYKK